MGSGERGMTLVETLVALAILSGVVLSAYAMISQSARFAALEEDRLIAGIVADNLAVEVLARDAPPDRGETEQELEVAGRKWSAKTVVTEAGDKIVRVELAVSRQGSAHVLAHVDTLMAQ